jgi:uncharacterized protein (DUF2062 family)
LNPVRRWLQGIATRARRLWRRALYEHASPPEIGWAVALGVFSGCSPLLGLHMWIALALATLFRVNRVWAFVGSRVSSNVFFAWIAFAEIELAHRLRTGGWAPLEPREALAHGRQLITDWFIGAAFVGAALGAALGAAAYLGMRRWRRLNPHTPLAPQPPTSESRPSAPPAPTP